MQQDHARADEHEVRKVRRANGGLNASTRLKAPRAMTRARVRSVRGGSPDAELSSFLSDDLVTANNVDFRCFRLPPNR